MNECFYVSLNVTLLSLSNPIFMSRHKVDLTYSVILVRPYVRTYVCHTLVKFLVQVHISESMHAIVHCNDTSHVEVSWVVFHGPITFSSL